MSETERTGARTACHLAISVTIEHCDFFFRGVMYNFSETGLYLETGYPTQKLQKLYLLVDARKRDTDKNLRENRIYTGEVAWQRNLVHSLTADYGIGIRLLACDRNKRQRGRNGHARIQSFVLKQQ